MNSQDSRRALADLVRYPSSGVAPASPFRRDEEDHDGFFVEHLAWKSPTGEAIPALLVGPPDAGRHPAVLYCHAHGGRYEIGMRELLEGRPSLISPYGAVLARSGFVALCVEMPTFGGRASPNESHRSKERLWYGDTLYGEMLRDLGQGLAYLRSRPDVDPGRIATLGLSMGATHAFWMAALEPTINRVAHLCSYADLGTLIATGGHDLHGHYMTVPSLLAHFTTGQICGLIAPRPQLVGVGYRDPLTPKAAVTRALSETRDAYEALGSSDSLVVIDSDDAGHVETRAMRDGVLSFLNGMRG